MHRSGRNRELAASGTTECSAGRILAKGACHSASAIVCLGCKCVPNLEGNSNDVSSSNIVQRLNSHCNKVGDHHSTGSKH